MPSLKRFLTRTSQIVIGKSRDPRDPAIFHKISLMAFFAWIGLGADGLSSSSYGPEEAFRVLVHHPHLGLVVALASAFTIFIIASSYNQIVELFPTGGGGYLVASKLLGPNVGMVSGCALLVDYVLTISLSVSSGVDALFSFLPKPWLDYKLEAALAGIILLVVMNLRGVKESVAPLVPIFLIFIFTHAAAFLYAIVTHSLELGRVAGETAQAFHGSVSELGLLGTLIVIMKAYSMGAGTYTGIEAVSNGLPILREPRVHTARRTMRYMAISLAVTVVGLMLCYLLYRVQPTADMSKTLNAVLFESMTTGWGGWGRTFVFVTLLSEATLLFVAAQTGFLDGPRVLATMALDRWFPTRYAMLSNRLVTKNGIILMGAAAFCTVALSRGSVRFLVVLYSINVFVTFALSQTGMVKHWWAARGKLPRWRRKLAINGVGLGLTLLILCFVVVIKFHEGGWLTILVTGSLMALVIFVKRHYLAAQKMLHKLHTLVVASSKQEVFPELASGIKAEEVTCDPHEQTAVVLVGGYNGVGLHTVMAVNKLFHRNFKNYVFIQIGMVDAGNFKGVEELAKLHDHVRSESDRYVEFARRHGYHADGFTAVGNDVVKEVLELAPRIARQYPNCIFFGGQLVFPEETFVTRWLHNYITFALQRGFYQQGIPFVIVPIRVD